MTTVTAAPAAPAVLVRRSQRSTKIGAPLLGLAVLVLAYLPFITYTTVTSTLITFFILLIMATMWNLLAGFAGLVSVGQQAYVGLGAYAVLQLSDWGVQPFLGVALAAGVCALVAVPTSLLAFRLRGDYFAVGTWVIAEAYRLVMVRDDALGGGSGRSLTTLSGIDQTVREAMTYWTALAVVVVCIAGSYLLLRGRLGLALTAVRDNEVAARSVGVKVTRAKRVVYLVSAAGCGAAGGLLLVSTLNVRPDSVFSVQWSAYMIFIVVIGGIGHIEGALVGSVVFFALQQLLADYGSWYLVLVGVVAMASALWVRGGLWGVLSRRTGVRLFPIGYTVDRS
jgi:branched-chain amino acid transport system permease protein